MCVLTPKADEFIKSGRALTMRLPKENERKPHFQKADGEHQNPELFEELRTLRKKLATSLGVPPYVVFSDAVLWNMCARLPKTHDELLEISGIGTMKAERYGRRFLAVINEYVGNKP